MQQAEAVSGERRSSLRRVGTWRVRLSRDNGEELDAACTDISEGGLGLQTRVPLTVGEVIRVHFVGVAADDPQHLPERIQVIYRIREQYGASFCP